MAKFPRGKFTRINYTRVRRKTSTDFPQLTINQPLCVIKTKNMSTEKLKGAQFFFYFNLMLLILVVGAFGVNGIVNFENLPPISLLVIIHGICMLAWYSLVVVQAKLIRQSNHNIHITLGKFSIALAAGIVISGILMTLDSYARSSRVDIVTVNLFITINFIILYSLALLRRRQSDKHKRLILFTSISMILPALGRITQAIGINEFISIAILVILVLVPSVYDYRTLKRVHKSTIFGICLIFIGIALTVNVMESSSWIQFLESTIGKT